MTPDPTRLDQATDADLMERMATGDRDAFAVLFRRYQVSVYRFSAQMTGSKEVAEDVTQEVFIALARTRTRYEPALGSLSTYLYGIARHLVLQRRKRSRSMSEVDIDTLDDDGVPVMAVSIDPMDELSRAERIQTLRRAILRLPVHYREVVVLCELNGVSYEEAARIVGCPAGTVRSRLHRGRRLLIERCRAVLSTAAEGSCSPRRPDTLLRTAEDSGAGQTRSWLLRRSRPLSQG